MVSLGIVYKSFNGKSFAAMCGTKGVGALYLRISRATACMYFISTIWSPAIKESDSGDHINSTSSRTFAKTSGCESRTVTAQRNDEVEAS